MHAARTVPSTQPLHIHARLSNVLLGCIDTKSFLKNSLTVPALLVCVADFNLSKILKSANPSSCSSTDGGGVNNPRWLASLEVAASLAAAPILCAHICFGSASLRQSLLPHTVPWLQAPEIMGGGRATAASDVFSFGLVMAEVSGSRHAADARADAA